MAPIYWFIKNLKFGKKCKINGKIIPKKKTMTL